MEKTIMTSVKIQRQVHLALQKKVIDEGYGMRGKSKWIAEAIESFFSFQNYPELVHIAEEMETLDDVVSVRLPKSLVEKIDRAIMEVRLQFPILEGVKSNLIRASIVQRLLRS